MYKKEWGKEFHRNGGNRNSMSLPERGGWHFQALQEV
jgi:hypothetical protein